MAKKRGTIDNEDVVSPTVALDSALLNSKIYAEEGRDVAIIDTPDALIQTRIEYEEEKVILRMKGNKYELLMTKLP